MCPKCRRRWTASRYDTGLGTEPDGRSGIEDDSSHSRPTHTDRRRAMLGGSLLTIVVTAAAFAIYHQRHAFAAALDNVGFSACSPALPSAP